MLQSHIHVYTVYTYTPVISWYTMPPDIVSPSMFDGYICVTCIAVCVVNSFSTWWYKWPCFSVLIFVFLRPFFHCFTRWFSAVHHLENKHASAGRYSIPWYSGYHCLVSASRIATNENWLSPNSNACSVNRVSLLEKTILRMQHCRFCLYTAEIEGLDTC